MENLKIIPTLLVLMLYSNPLSAQAEGEKDQQKTQPLQAAKSDPGNRITFADLPYLSLSASIGPTGNVWAAGLTRRLKRAWFPPKDAGVVTIAFEVERDGTASKIRVANPSGSSVTDAAALKAVENAAPFRPLPEGTPKSISVEYKFDYGGSLFGRKTK